MALTRAVNLATESSAPSSEKTIIDKCFPLSHSFGKEVAFVDNSPCSGNLECQKLMISTTPKWRDIGP